MKQIVALFVLLSLSSYAQDSTACACCDLHHDQFDFWVGDWVVYDTAGNEVGRNRIDEIQDNCALRESWTSPNSTGTSYNYFNRSDSTWNQLWVDNSGSQLELKGNAIANGMELRSDWLTAKSGKKYCNQIVWEEQEDGSVTQTWNILGMDNTVLQTVFHGIYRRIE